MPNWPGRGEEITYLFSGLEFFTIEAVEQKGKKKVEHHKISHHKCGQKDGKARFSYTLKVAKNALKSSTA